MVGLIGAGLLGKVVAERLLKGGHPCRVYDSDPQRLQQAAELGATAGASAAEVAVECDLLFLCLPNGRVVQEVVFAQGVSQGMPRGSILVDLTTCSPSESRKLAEKLRDRGVRVLDAPISGGSQAVLVGQALMMVGGEEAVYQEAREILEAIAPRVRYLGPSGSGSTAKLITNLVLGLNRLALAEGLALAEATGLEPAAALELLQESAAYSRVMEAKGGRMAERRYDHPEARLRQHLKDVELILELGREHDQALPASQLHAELLQAVVSRGLGEADNAAVIEALRRAP